MVNPLRGFISENRRLFKTLDDEGAGIEVYTPRSVRSLVRIVSEVLLGRTVHVTSCGDTVLVNKQDVEAFLERNASKFAGAFEAWMSPSEKLLRIVEMTKSSLSGLPRGLLEEYAQGGVEGKKLVVGLAPQFVALIDSLEQNHGFQLTKLRAHIFSFSEDKYLEFDRDELFSKIVEENASRIGKLSATSGRPEICRLVDQLMIRLNVLGRKKR